MLRKLLLVGVFAGSSASVPILYQANPEAFHRFVENVASSEPEAAPIEVAAVSAPSPSPVTEAPLGRKVRLQADERGHFTAEFRLNGRRVPAMVDTGATLVALNLSTARRIGLNLTADDFKYEVTTANGSTKAASASIERLQIGKIEVADVQAVVLEDSALNGTLIGISFLKHLGKYQVENGSLLLVQ